MNTETTPTNSEKPRRWAGPGPLQLAGILALIAPLAYLTGRLGVAVVPGALWKIYASGVTNIALGALVGIPLGLFFGTLRPSRNNGLVTGAPHQIPTIDQASVLTQIRLELLQIQSMFKARRGNQTVLARIEYPTEFWKTAQASGQLFIVGNTGLLRTIATAYYWAKEANHIETLAFDSQFSSTPSDNQNAATHLVAEARLLDGSLEAALGAALAALDAELAKPQA